MATTLTSIATEGSTYVVTCAFADEDGDATIPTSAVAWRLLDERGNEISTGSEAAAASVDIILSGDELAIDNTTRELHWVTLVVSTTYDSTLGSDLPLVDTVKFQIRNIFDTP